MAAIRDLLGRAERLGAAVVYQGAPAQWLVKAAGVAASGAPVVVNTKGTPVERVAVLVSLAELERLTAAAAQVDALRVLMPDRMGVAADGDTVNGESE